MKKIPDKRKKGFAVKKKKRDFRGFFHGVIYVSALTLFIVAGVGFYKYLLTLSYFDIREITIMGGDKVSAREIIRDSGINVGENLLSTDVNEVKNRIEKHPWIKKAEVRRLYPSELEISVLERVPAALIKFDDIYYIDGDGVVFERVASEDEINLPVITGVEMKEILKDDSSGSEGIFKALSFMEVFEKKNFNHVGEISEIKVDKLNGLTLYTMNGAVKIDIGNGDFENKLYRFESIVTNLKSGLNGIDFVDLESFKKNKKAVGRHQDLADLENLE